MASELSDPVLQQIESQIEANLTPEVKADYDKIVVAGGHLALDNGGAMMTQLAKAPDPIIGAAKGAVGLVMIMRKDAKGVMPMKAAVPAAMTLMLKALDFIDRSKIAKIGPDELARATHAFTDYLFARMGITKQGLANVAQKVHGLTQDPSAMAQINLKAGVTRHPMAATLTPMPPSAGGMINSPPSPPSDSAA